MTHYGGYVGTDSPTTCFDVTDDADFQVYKAGTATTRTNQKIADTWPIAARRNGQIVQTFYRSYLTNESEACGAGRDGTTLSQYGSQACNEANTGFKFNVILKLYYGNDLQLSTTAQLRTQHDFTFTARSTAATFSAGRWAINDGYPTTFSFGTTGDVPLVTTAGDGFATIGVWRPKTATYFLAGPTGAFVRSQHFGTVGDVPVAAQYQGLGAPTQLAVFRPATGIWYFAGPTGATASHIGFGTRGDVPVPGRWMTSNADSVAVFRPGTGTWFIRGVGTIGFGKRGDIPAPADYNGDGRTDIAVYRPATHTFFVRGGPSLPYGTTGDIPVTDDFNGDGSADLAVYRPSTRTWYVRGISTFTFGSGTTIGAAPFRG